MTQEEIENELEVIYKEIQNLRLNEFRSFDVCDFNTYIIVGFLPSASIAVKIGRVVQIREEWGCYGSNQIFIRHYTNELQVHENQWFYKVPEKYIQRLNAIFSNTEADIENTTYSYKGRFKRKGFIVKSKIKNGISTPMRDINKAINNKINEILNP